MLAIKSTSKINGKFIGKSRIDGTPIYMIDEHELNRIQRYNEFNFMNDRINISLVSMLEDHCAIQRMLKEEKEVSLLDKLQTANIIL